MRDRNRWLPLALAASVMLGALLLCSSRPVFEPQPVEVFNADQVPRFRVEGDAADVPVATPTPIWSDKLVPDLAAMQKGCGSQFALICRGDVCTVMDDGDTMLVRYRRRPALALERLGRVVLDLPREIEPCATAWSELRMHHHWARIRSSGGVVCQVMGNATLGDPGFLDEGQKLCDGLHP